MVLRYYYYQGVLVSSIALACHARVLKLNAGGITLIPYPPREVARSECARAPNRQHDVQYRQQASDESAHTRDTRNETSKHEVTP